MTKRPYMGPSEAQAAALAARGAPYTEAHLNSYELKMNRAPVRLPLRELVHRLRRAYADEVPTRMHVHETDAGGDPAWSPEFTRYLTGSDFATDRGDSGTTEVYVTPFRRCLSSMASSNDLATRRRASIVAKCITGDVGPIEATTALGVPDWCAKIVAADALNVFHQRLSDIRLDLQRTDTAA